MTLLRKNSLQKNAQKVCGQSVQGKEVDWRAARWKRDDGGTNMKEQRLQRELLKARRRGGAAKNQQVPRILPPPSPHVLQYLMKLMATGLLKQAVHLFNLFLSPNKIIRPINPGSLLGPDKQVQVFKFPPPPRPSRATFLVMLL